VDRLLGSLKLAITELCIALAEPRIGRTATFSPTDRNKGLAMAASSGLHSDTGTSYHSNP